MMAVVAILIGLTTGVISGLIGLGGGGFIVPALVYVFKTSQHEAQGRSLATLLLPIGLFGFLEYYRQAVAGWRDTENRSCIFHSAASRSERHLPRAVSVHHPPARRL
jgi:hypothetical protein